jgi:tetratricopeptide (TPR) repeat protein
MHRWSWRPALYAVVFAAVFAAACARAQELSDAGSPSATPASTSAPTAAELDQLQARRKTLFQQMLANPTNLDVAFEYAGLSARVGDVEAAIATLERMLIFAPGLPRLQLELGVLYFRLGAYETARSYFEQALKAPNVPAVVKTRVDPYLAAINEQTKGYSFHGSIMTGLRYQTNANSAPTGGTVTIGGLPFQLDENATGVPDFNTFVAANFNYSQDLQNQGDRLNVNLATYGAWYKKRHDIDTMLAELKIGPLFDLQRFGMKNTALGFYGILTGIMLADEPYLGSAGAGSTFTTLLTPRTQLQIQEEYRREQYENSELRPTTDLRTGHRIDGTARVQQQLSDRFAIFAAVEGERRITWRDYLDVWQWGGSAGWVLAFNPIAKQPDKWTFGVTGGFLRRDYDGPDETFSDEAEWDKERYVVGTFNIPFRDGWGLQAQSGYRSVDSNYDTRIYENIHGSVAIAKRF